MNLRANVPPALRELRDWDALSSDERRAAAEKVTALLPVPWRLLGLETHSLGGASHETVFFDFEGTRFVLIPGSSDATLGYDPEVPWVPPTPEHAESLAWSAEQRYTFLFDGLTPPRTVALAPFLMESEPTQATWADEVGEEYEDADVLDEGALDAAVIAAKYRLGAFRLPTADEWEYACRAGTGTLWRWGDTIPVEPSYRPGAFDEHRKWNAFGLRFNSDTYWTEMCDGGEIRGGDGGSSACGGYGAVATWLPLASAYQDPPELFEGAPIEYGEQMWVRRVCPIAE